MKRYPLNPIQNRTSVTDFQNSRASLLAQDGMVRRAAPSAMPQIEDLIDLAIKISGARTKRRNFFASDLFAEPAWEMLLALFRASASGYRMSVSNMCLASEGPNTTALRWIDRLEELGLVTRLKNPLDARVVFIELPPATRDHIENYLMETWVSLYQEQ